MIVIFSYFKQEDILRLDYLGTLSSAVTTIPPKVLDCISRTAHRSSLILFGVLQSVCGRVPWVVTVVLAWGVLAVFAWRFSYFLPLELVTCFATFRCHFQRGLSALTTTCVMFLFLFS